MHTGKIQPQLSLECHHSRALTDVTCFIIQSLHYIITVFNTQVSTFLQIFLFFAERIILEPHTQQSCLQLYACALRKRTPPLFLPWSWLQHLWTSVLQDKHYGRYFVKTDHSHLTVAVTAQLPISTWNSELK